MKSCCRVASSAGMEENENATYRCHEGHASDEVESRFFCEAENRICEAARHRGATQAEIQDGGEDGHRGEGEATRYDDGEETPCDDGAETPYDDGAENRGHGLVASRGAEEAASPFDVEAGSLCDAEGTLHGGEEANHSCVGKAETGRELLLVPSCEPAGNVTETGTTPRVGDGEDFATCRSRPNRSRSRMSRLNRWTSPNPTNWTSLPMLPGVAPL